MTDGPPYGQGTRMLTLDQVCAWFNITERHVRKLVERDAIPYRKIGHLLRFAEAELEQWSRPKKQRASDSPKHVQFSRQPNHAGKRPILPRSLIE